MGDLRFVLDELERFRRHGGGRDADGAQLSAGLGGSLGGSTHRWKLDKTLR